jgi:hypothetical protein
MEAYWAALGKHRPPGARADVTTALLRHRHSDTQFLALVLGALSQSTLLGKG